MSTDAITGETTGDVAGSHAATVAVDAMSLAQLRDHRDHLREVEAQVSYWRRLVYARIDLIRMLGTSYADIERQGVSLAVVDASLRYHAAARYDDMIRVRTTLVEARSRTVTFDYVIENAETGVKLVSARTTLASINDDGKLVSMPDHLRKSLESAVA